MFLPHWVSLWDWFGNKNLGGQDTFIYKDLDSRWTKNFQVWTIWGRPKQKHPQDSLQPKRHVGFHAQLTAETFGRHRRASPVFNQALVCMSTVYGFGQKDLHVSNSPGFFVNENLRLDMAETFILMLR